MTIEYVLTSPEFDALAIRIEIWENWKGRHLQGHFRAHLKDTLKNMPQVEKLLRGITDE